MPLSRQRARLRAAAEHRRQRLVLANAGFLATFAAARGVTHAIKRGIPPFHNVGGGGKHIHHMTFGILDLLLVGYLWTLQVGTGHEPHQLRLSRLTAALFGAGAALTLDEFALWLNLEDDYWSKEGRASIDAVVLFGALLALAASAGPVGRRLAKRRGDRARVLRHPRRAAAILRS